MLYEIKIVELEKWLSFESLSFSVKIINKMEKMKFILKKMCYIFKIIKRVQVPFSEDKIIIIENLMLGTFDPSNRTYCTSEIVKIAIISNCTERKLTYCQRTNQKLCNISCRVENQLIHKSLYENTCIIKCHDIVSNDRNEIKMGKSIKGKYDYYFYHIFWFYNIMHSIYCILEWSPSYNYFILIKYERE